MVERLYGRYPYRRARLCKISLLRLHAMRIEERGYIRAHYYKTFESR